MKLPSFLASSTLRQIRVLAGIELRRTFGRKRALGLILFALFPVALALLRAVFLPTALKADLGRSGVDFANIFYVLQLRFVVYFACAFLFVRSLRGEILQQSLHYLLLAPVRREILALGKYLGALGSAVIALVPSTALLFVFIYLAHGTELGLSFLLSPRGMSHGAAYLAATALACVGYGALFFLAGLFFKNPMIPAGLYLAFEFFAPFLPLYLKVLSVAQHLRALLPVKLSLGGLDSVASPFGVAGSTALLLGVTVVALVLAARRATSLEVTYSDR